MKKDEAVKKIGDMLGDKHIHISDTKKVKDFRITFRQEVVIQATTKEEAQEVFQDLNLQDLKNELGNGIIQESAFVEEVSVDELKLN